MRDFGEILEPEIPRLRRYARALTRDPVQVDDLAKHARARPHQKASLALAARHEFAHHWLFTILHNQRGSELPAVTREQRALAGERAASVLPASPDTLDRVALLELDRAVAGLTEARCQVGLLVG